MNKILIISLFLVITSCVFHAQDVKENWVTVSFSKSEALYINVTGISIFTGDEVFVWVLQETKSPINMDGIDKDIYKTKTYYLINKTLMRYSILQVLYFDENDNLLKNYSYDHTADNPELKYSTPIMHGSDIEKVLAKCLEYIPIHAKGEK